MNTNTRIRYTGTLLLGVIIGTAGMYAFDLHAQSTAIVTPSAPSRGANDLVVKPIDPTDTAGWKAYLGDLVQKNLHGMSASRPFA